MRGYILKSNDSTRHFFSSCIRGNVEYVTDRNHAWFTVDLATAAAMAIDIAISTGVRMSIMRIDIPHDPERH